MLKRWDVQAYKTVEAYVNGKLQPGRDKVWNLRNSGVGLGAISSKVPGPLVRKIDRIRAQMVAGKISVPDTLG